MEAKELFDLNTLPTMVRHSFHCLSLAHTRKDQEELLTFANVSQQGFLVIMSIADVGDEMSHEVMTYLDTVTDVLESSGDEETTFNALKRGLQTIVKNQSSSILKDLLSQHGENIHSIENGAMAAACNAGMSLIPGVQQMEPDDILWVARTQQLASLNGLTQPISQQAKQALRQFLGTGEIFEKLATGQIDVDELGQFIEDFQKTQH